MCVFVAVSKDVEHLQKRFKAIANKKNKFSPIYSSSAFTFQKIPVITNENPEQIDFYNWGLIPFWVKDEKHANQIRKFNVNARNETIFEKPSFRHSINNKRCLILADGFFEYHELNKKKYPFFIQLKNKDLFALAGIWDEWTNKATGELIRSFSILTKEANPLMEKIHNNGRRMPIILAPKNESKWINNENNFEINEFLKTIDESALMAFPVSSTLAKLGHNTTFSEIGNKVFYPELNLTF
jgi:putative SOS response-associated peptidase YedK